MADPFEISFEFRNKRFRNAEDGLEALRKHMSKGWDGAPVILKKELRTFLDGVATAMARRHGNPWPGGTTSRTLSKRSGRGIKSILESVTVSGTKLDDVVGGIGGEFYLRIQETGGTIKPRKAKYLAIPLPAALNSNGTPKKSGPRKWDKTFVQKSKKGNLLIFRRQGSQIVPLYVLKKQVKIPARLGMGDTLRAGLPLFVDRAMSRMLKGLVQG